MITKTCTECGNTKSINEFPTAKLGKFGKRGNCKECKNKDKNLRRKKQPWKRTLESIKQRCMNPNNEKYHRYGGRGIECRITVEELEFLWFRDKAYDMKKPSIDREDNDGNYELSNCRYIELIENTVKDKQKSISQFDLQGNFIREFPSIKIASQIISCHSSSIWNALNGRTKTCLNFIWKYKVK